MTIYGADGVTMFVVVVSNNTVEAFIYYLIQQWAGIVCVCVGGWKIKVGVVHVFDWDDNIMAMVVIRISNRQILSGLRCTLW